MRRSLFDRVFTYAASAAVLPAENLATEVTAYFLEHWPPFQDRFLIGLGIADSPGTWTVATQQRIYAPGKGWHGKIPDLLLRSETGVAMVLIEVKVDAGVTFSGELAQTQLYRDFLNDQVRQEQIGWKKLVTLTRWKPDASLLAPVDQSIRFNDVARWLEESIDEGRPKADPMVSLAEQWLNFLKQRRWIMSPITMAHVNAIKAMGELTPQLWEVLGAARESVLSQGSTWTTPPRARASSGSLFDGSVLWVGAIARGSLPNASAQMGFFYGLENGETALYPLVLFYPGLELKAPAELLALVRPYGTVGEMVCFPNIVPSIKAGASTQAVLDKAQDDLVSVFAHLQSTALASSTAILPPPEPPPLSSS